MDPTEQKKELPWEERKSEATRKIRTFSHDALLVKSADLISNASNILEDCENDGESVFDRFNAPAAELIIRWSEVRVPHGLLFTMRYRSGNSCICSNPTPKSKQRLVRHDDAGVVYNSVTKGHVRFVAGADSSDLIQNHGLE